MKSEEPLYGTQPGGWRCHLGHEFCNLHTAPFNPKEILESMERMLKYERHTVEIDHRRPMSFDDATHSDRISGWCVFWAFVGAIVGYMVGRWVLPHLVGP